MLVKPDVIGYEDSKCYWCVLIRLLSRNGLIWMIFKSRLSLIVGVNVVLNRTVVVDSD